MSQKTYDSVNREYFSPRSALVACVSNMSINDPSLFKICVNTFWTNLVFVPVSFAIPGYFIAWFIASQLTLIDSPNGVLFLSIYGPML